MNKSPHPATNVDLRKYIGAAVAAFTVLTSGGVFAGAQWVISDARAQSKEAVDAGVDAERRARAELERKLDEHIKDELQARREQATAAHNTQLDLRELYNSMRFDRPSERLAKPPPPLPSADAGR